MFLRFGCFLRASADTILNYRSRAIYSDVWQVGGSEWCKQCIEPGVVWSCFKVSTESIFLIALPRIALKRSVLGVLGRARTL